MPTFTWLGGGSNSFNTPSDWNPQGPPADGDSIIMPSGLDMAIGGATVTGAVVTLGSNDTISLSGGALLGVAGDLVDGDAGADQVTAEAARWRSAGRSRWGRRPGRAGRW